MKKMKVLKKKTFSGEKKIVTKIFFFDILKNINFEIIDFLGPPSSCLGPMLYNFVSITIFNTKLERLYLIYNSILNSIVILTHGDNCTNSSRKNRQGHNLKVTGVTQNKILLN